MKPELTDHLVCPTCKTKLELHVQHWEQGQIETGALDCAICDVTYPIKRYVPRFVDSDKYAGTFSKQRLYVRRHFEHYEHDRSGDRQFLQTTGFDEAGIVNGLSLEVGCGYGRFLDVVDRMGGEIIGVDLSTHSIDLSQDFVGLRDRVHLVQCDLFHLPFPVEHFDRVFSIGVLHHTPDTKAAVLAICPYMKRDGQIAIWVYPPEMKVSADRWRAVTTKLPEDLLYYLCVANQALFSWIRALPGGWRINKIIPGAVPAATNTFWMRVLGDFDNLSPKYAHSHTPDEVTRWLDDWGFEEISVLERRTAVRATKRLR
jgi:SAM-dependent methyltransferase